VFFIDNGKLVFGGFMFQVQRIQIEFVKNGKKVKAVRTV
jgi:hypothetical protein